MPDFKNTLYKSGTHAVVAGAGLDLMTNGASFEFKGRRYRVGLVGAVLGAVSSLANDFIHAQILPHISHNQKLAHMESLVLTLVSGAGVFTAGAYVMNSNLNSSEVKKFMAVGALSEVISSYAYSNFIVPQFIE